MQLVSYVALKLAAYILWCGIGVRMFRPDSPRKFSQALGFGTTRLIIGIIFGVGVFVAAPSFHFESWGTTHLQIYFKLYAPLRWVEWSIMGFLLERSAASLLVGPTVSYSTGPASFFRTPRSRFPGVLWKLGGVAVSHAADLPLIMAAGGIENMLPFGRFLC